MSAGEGERATLELPGPMVRAILEGRKTQMRLTAADPLAAGIAAGDRLRVREAGASGDGRPPVALEVLEVRRERHARIVEEDARAEGFAGRDTTRDPPGAEVETGHGTTLQPMGGVVWAVGEFLDAWDRLHGEGAAAADPEVVVIAFRHLPPP